MDVRKVKKLIELLEESGISEIEIHEGEESVRVSRASTAAAQPVMVGVPSAPAERTDHAESGEGGAAREETLPEGHVVRAPMVGIFYESAAPGKPAFVQPGQRVSPGEVLCIIEAMKIMNQIESEVGGVVTRIMAENGEPVEYGQELFVIREE
jgi:acetyl-CoA carboxylase biotin carboxyl carrier protein